MCHLQHRRHCETISSGKYRLPSYDSKAEVEAYIRTLPIKSAFFAPGVFMQTFSGGFAPRPLGETQPGVYAIVDMMDFGAESGHFGVDMAARVKQSAAEIPYKLTSLDEYIAANIKLA